MQHCALQNTLKSSGRRRVIARLAGQIIEFIVNKGDQVLA